MKSLIISNFPVGPKFNGGSMTVWGIISYFVEKNKDLVLYLTCSTNQKNSSQYEECLSILKKNNLEYKIFFYKEKKINKIIKILNFIASILFGHPHFFFPNHISLKKEIENKIKDFNFDKVICYHFDALSTCYDIESLNLMLGDLIHEPRKSRRELLKNNSFSTLINYFEEVAGFRVMKKLTKKSSFIGFFSNNYANIFSHKVKKSHYIKTPIVDFEKTYHESNLDEKLNFLMIGHLKGTVTISSLVFLEKLIRKYEDNLNSLNVRFNIVGGNRLNEINNYLLTKHKLIKFYGESFNITEFFGKNQFLLVPNEIDIGIRVRIITGLSYGAIIITHKSNLKGIPELENGDNCLLFSNEEELIKIFKKIKENEIDILKIKKNAVKTFSENFYYKKSVSEILEKVNNA
tara:strand:- start:25757 stop:26971 length:1215 start_codon:yes stop_codon:yes gene_type:complete